MGLLDRLFGKRNTTEPKHTIERRKPPKATIKWRNGSFPMEVVGESNYQEALIEVCGGYSRDGYELELVAEIEREPSNPYDENAILVSIDGHTVGYLSRDQAQRLSAQMIEDGIERARCSSKTVGGWRTNQHDSGHFGVRLGIPTWGWIDFGIGKQAPAPEKKPTSSSQRKPEAAKSGPLKGEWVVVWGEPKYGKVAQELAGLGANIMAGVGKSTTMVVHIEDELTVGSRLSSTYEKAQKRIDEGSSLELVSLREIRERLRK
ncbi:MAG: HIRAN domain-containing protein [Roseobacter sp.]|jgi:hypothetical protein|nr:HIRAN domain-containing protein [Roseobacter sp.]